MYSKRLIINQLAFVLWRKTCLAIIDIITYLTYTNLEIFTRLYYLHILALETVQYIIKIRAAILGLSATSVSLNTYISVNIPILHIKN